ncbi:uncharacterized protein LOC133530662 [Cydia pomonella]|uniref:uncharacterized protein LOC133530662 n=1 Tax=Cydia pomonella TaxID=82600 RepID=UPI002ADD60D5|nr:uncharacterized protein LOC133530662 [Cydia pomonella]XP_061724657.1 uncharacterized protein LOC133530662 [Cydia pomonella]
MEQQIVVKTEMQPNEEILLFYVDEEDGTTEHGVVTTIENIEQQQVAQLQEDNTYLVEQSSAPYEEPMEEDHAWAKDKWTDDETKRLLVFYVDNKTSFLGGATTKKHLWTVACKTMLSNKNHAACEMKLRNLKRKYTQLRIEQEKGFDVIWPYFQLSHQAFHDDKYVNAVLEEEKARMAPKPVVPARSNEDAGIVVVKKVNSKHAGDGNVEAMLNLYLKHKKISSHKVKQRNLWQNIALQIGTDDGDYWHKRFLNFKSNYVRLLEKRNLEGPESISWPYMKLFDQIYEGDEEFQKKHGPQKYQAPMRIEQYQQVPAESLEHIWNQTELTVLVKYYFDCYQEFQDKTIPNSFLWNEVGRLIDKNPDSCKAKYEELRAEHLGKYIEGGYEIRNRAPLAILFDNIICKDVQLEIATKSLRAAENDMWKTEELDELVQFFYDNVEVFKDSVCYFVCWAAISKKLRRTIAACRKQWKELTRLYKSILDDKKENPDMQIDWRYIELFDCIFVYGMDTHLLDGYEKLQDQEKESEKVGVKKVEIKSDDENEFDEIISEDEESYDERGFMKRSKRRPGESKSFKILEYYQKNKDKFNSPFRKKLALWEVLAKDIGISATQCAHRFRNLKQVYTKYVQREINKPEKPILWPYYAHCKKVFGYRAIKSKLRNGKKDTDDEEDWSAKEIKQLIVYFSQNFDDINSNLEDKSKWSALAAEIGKLEDACSDKLLELRKSYRKLKTMKTRNPDVKISWKYFNMFDEIYSAREDTSEIVQEIEINGDGYEELNFSDVKMEVQDDDFQCIIVIPEGQDINDMSNAQIIMSENGQMQPYIQVQTETQQTVKKWTKKTKKTLLIHYINYLRMNRGKEINATDMWKEISAKLNMSPLSCRKMFAKLKENHLQLADEVDPNKRKTPYYTLLEKIVAMKPKFVKTGQKKTIKGEKVYTDVALPDEKVQQALLYYLEHVGEFVSPKFENKYLWTELANHISEPLNNILRKINYLKQNFDSQTGKVAGEDTSFTDILREIVTKESALTSDIQNDPKPDQVEIKVREETWTDEETEQLLSWYLANLEKFKNPKFVRSYLWMEAADILQKSALVCSKKMTEVRTQYKTLIKESPEELNNWKFYDLCQKIYGTGKRNAESMMILDTTQNV